MSREGEISKLIADIKDSAEYWGEMARIDFAQQVHEELSKQKLSQKQLAAQLGVSQAYIHRVLAGESNCTLSQMAKLMLALGKRLRFYSTPLDDSPIAAKAEELSRMLKEFAVLMRADAKKSVD